MKSTTHTYIRNEPQANTLAIKSDNHNPATKQKTHAYTHLSRHISRHEHKVCEI